MWEGLLSYLLAVDGLRMLRQQEIDRLSSEVRTRLIEDLRRPELLGALNTAKEKFADIQRVTHAAVWASNAARTTDPACDEQRPSGLSPHSCQRIETPSSTHRGTLVQRPPLSPLSRTHADQRRQMSSPRIAENANGTKVSGMI